MLHHVQAERDLGVGRDAGVGGPDEDADPGEPGEGSAPGPAVAAGQKGDDARDVERCEGDASNEEERFQAESERDASQVRGRRVGESEK